MNNNSKFGYTLAEIAKSFDVSLPTIYKEINAGRLKTFKIGRRRFISPEAAAQYVKDREAETA